MGLQRFERALERLVEGAFAKAFKSGLQPVELGRRLTREMDLKRNVSVSGMVAPNHFEIRLGPADAERFESFMDAMKRELVETAREHARTERYNFVGPVAIEIDVNEAFSAGRFTIKASMLEQPGGGPTGLLVLTDGRRIQLTDTPVTIGRLPECEVALPDPNISRRHAEVKRHGNDYVVIDLGSTNGTKVNGLAVSGERRLVDGDVITLGATTVKFESA